MTSLEAWDRQIALFARYFLRHANLPQGVFSLLDVGCGTGAALRAMRASRPDAVLRGCDAEEEHVAISRRMSGEGASYFVADALGYGGSYDVIYISNLLEHIEAWQAAADHALARCRRLYVLVPYRERIGARRSAVPGVDHVASFDERSFDGYAGRGASVETRVIRTPWAWGHPLRREVVLRIRGRLRGAPVEPQRELLVAVTNPGGAGWAAAPALRSRLRAFLGAA